jgi:hypothetical protein
MRKIDEVIRMTLNTVLIAVAALGGGALSALLLSRWVVEG